MAAGYEDTQVASGAGLARRVMNEPQPTIVLVDLALASTNGFELLQGIQRDFLDARVVLIVDDAMYQPLALEGLVIGASGLVYRNQGIASLLRVLQVVDGGDVAIPRDVTALMLHALRQRPVQHHSRVQLSTRQREVLELVARGLTDRDISEELRISMTTVRSHLRVIFEKTSTGNRTAAALWANAYLDEATP